MKIEGSSATMKKDNWGLGQKPVLVKIDIKEWIKLQITCKNQNISINRAINIAIKELNETYRYIL